MQPITIGRRWDTAASDRLVAAGSLAPGDGPAPRAMRLTGRWVGAPRTACNVSYAEARYAAGGDALGCIGDCTRALST